MGTRRRKVEVGSGNIFADLGLPDAEDMLLKSTIVIELRRLINQRKLTQSAAAKLIGISQGDLSNVLRGQFRGYSEAKLMRMLTAFDQDVEITTRPHRKAGEAGGSSSPPMPRKDPSVAMTNSIMARFPDGRPTPPNASERDRTSPPAACSADGRQQDAPDDDQGQHGLEAVRLHRVSV